MRILIFIFLSAIVAILLLGNLCAKTSFAVLPFELKEEITSSDEMAALARFNSDLLKSKKYKLVDRKRIQEVIKEQEFQMTGAIDQSKMIKAGKILGVDKLVTSILSKTPGSFCMQINVINVETGAIELSTQECDDKPAKAASLCARRLILKYPMEGRIIGIAGGQFVIDLGKNEGIGEKQELFVARKDLMKDDAGNVLFEDFYRIGKLKAEKISEVRATAKILSLKEKNKKPKKDDVVSPEPIPDKGPRISHKPFFPKAKKGKLILSDNMKNMKYLSILNNNGEDYVKGKLNLDNSAGEYTHTYCYYPAPFDKLTDFILEVEIEFRKIQEKYNRITISIREDRDYHYGSNYGFFINDEGNYEITMSKSGALVYIVPVDTSPYLKRNETDNHIKIVANGAKFDFYINDEFIIAFEEETIRKGGIGFYAEQWGHILVDNLKIWEIRE